MRIGNDTNRSNGNVSILSGGQLLTAQNNLETVHSRSNGSDSERTSPIDTEAPILNHNNETIISNIINKICNFAVEDQECLESNISILSEEDLNNSDIKNAFLNTNKEIPLKILESFIYRLHPPNQKEWNTLLKKALIDIITIDCCGNINIVCTETSTNMLNMYLLAFKIKDINALSIKEKMNFSNDLVSSVERILLDKIEAIKNTLPNYSTKSANFKQ